MPRIYSGCGGRGFRYINLIKMQSVRGTTNRTETKERSGENSSVGWPGYSFGSAAHFNFLLFRLNFSMLRSHLELQK